MLKNEEQDSEEDVGNKGNNINSEKTATITIIVIVAAVVFIILAIIAWGFVNEHSERIKFLTVNTLSLLVLVVIAIQAYIYRKQWHAMQQGLAETRKMVEQNERAVRAAEDSARTAQEALSAGARAYLMIEDMQLSPMLIGENWAVMLTLYNGGRTPAWSLETASEAIIAWDFPPDIPRPSGFDKRELVIPAGTKKQIEIVFKMVVTDEDRKAVNGGAMIFFAVGQIRYRDFQKQMWVLPFCVSFDPSRRRFKDHKAKTYIEPTA